MNSGLTKCALITGASSGFGLLTTVTLARRGWRVIASMRDVSRGGRLEEAARKAGVWERIELRRLDVTRGEQIEELASGLMESGARLDALINNAGFAVAGFADDVSDAELRMQLETNFFGAAAVTRALLPIFRRQGFGGARVRVWAAMRLRSLLWRAGRRRCGWRCGRWGSRWCWWSRGRSRRISGRGGRMFRSDRGARSQRTRRG